MKYEDKVKIYDITPRKGKHLTIYPLEGYEDRALKVFTAYPVKDWHEKTLRKLRWGDPPRLKGQPSMSVPLIEATKIQNHCWLEGLAPRVYSICGVYDGKKKYFAQEVEFLGDHFTTQDAAMKVYLKVKALGKIYGWHVEKNDVSSYDVIDGKLVDFNTFHFSVGHVENVKQLYSDLGRYGKKYYHPIPEWGLRGSPRGIERLDQMGLEDLSFAGKSVLDLGCSSGMMCRHAKDLGSAYTLGIDMPGKGSPDPVKAAYIVSNELEYWSLDFKNMDLTKDAPEGEWDIVFALSLNFHFDVFETLEKIDHKICIFEDNSKDRDADKRLLEMYDKVYLVGKTFDHDKDRGKIIYHCYK